MMGAGGAMMLWRLAWAQAFQTTEVPSIRPMARDKVQPHNRGSWQYYKLLRDINMLNRVWPYDGRPQTIWLDGPRHTLNTELAG